MQATGTPVRSFLACCDSRRDQNLLPMASLATLAAVQPATVKGLAGSSIAGTKLHVKPARQSFRPRSIR